MSEAVAETPTEETAPVEHFETNVANVLHEIVDSIPLRHEWENRRLHTAVANLDKDPATILQQADPSSPTDGSASQIALLENKISDLTALVEKLVAQGTPTVPVVETPAASVVESPAPVEGAGAPAPSGVLSGQ